MRWAHIGLGAQDPNGIQRPKLFSSHMARQWRHLEARHRLRYGNSGRNLLRMRRGVRLEHLQQWKRPASAAAVDVDVWPCTKGPPPPPPQTGVCIHIRDFCGVRSPKSSSLFLKNIFMMFF
jgi:hypothetical protein